MESLITSSANSHIKHIMHLTKKRERDKLGEIVLEGTRLIEEAIKSHLNFKYVLYDERAERDPRTLRLLEALIALGVNFQKTTPDLFDECADTQNPQGVLAVCDKFRLVNEQELLTRLKRGEGPENVVVGLDGIQDPGNLGTIIRTACGAGIGGILLGNGTVDPYNPKVLRSAMGAAFNVRMCADVSLTQAIPAFKAEGWRVVAATGEASIDYTKAVLGGKLLLIIGNEGSGVSSVIKAMADELIYIPMNPVLESLNASVAASILMYEARRQQLLTQG